MLKDKTALEGNNPIKNETILSRLYLGFILLLSGFLSFYAAWNEGYGNEYYAAAVKSMLTSFNNFFFVSFDPGGFVSVDKPPVALWIQALSAMIFGFHGWSLILPEALATVISTALIYHLVQRVFGKPAGLLSALIFALTPIVAAVSRTNNLDPILVMVLLLASWALIAAAEKGSFKLLLLSMGLVGVGFNIKMLEAFAVLPAFYLVYLLSPANKTGKKITHLAIATILLLAVSLSWATIVDMTPVDQRPYVGGSQTNSVLELALGYNGIQRIMPSGFPMSFGTGSGPTRLNTPDMQNTGFPEGMGIAGEPGMPAGGMSFGGMGAMEGGPAGVFRLLDQQMAGQISWLLPFAILGFFAAFAIIWRNKDERSDEKLRSLYFWGMWMLPMLFYFSISGFFHRYYLIALAPSIVALCGIGLALMWAEYKKGGRLSYLLPLSLAVTAATESFILLSYPDFGIWLIPVICIVCFISAVGLVLGLSGMDWPVKHAKPFLAFAIAALLVAPAIWSVTPILYGSSSVIPYAGPELSRGSAMFGMGSAPDIGTRMPPSGPGMGQMNTSAITRFLLNNSGNESFLVAVPSAMSAEGIILETGKPVMAVGGFGGSDPILTVDKLKQMIENDEVRYYMVMGMPDLSRVTYPGASNIPGQNGTGNMTFFRGMPGGMPGMDRQSEIDDWVKAHGTLVPASEWMGENADTPGNDSAPGFGMGSFELYDLKGST